VTPSGSDESLITRLLALPAAERMAALERACAEDPLLHDRMPELMVALAAAEDPGSAGSVVRLSPESVVLALEAALEIGPAMTTGKRIGPYKLLQEIGRGGFGTVWMAEQEGPIRRMVALKIIKAGMDTKEVIARFEAERQALALMDHPNIARVYDAGETDSGRPFFVMELVRGVPITRYCDENRLPVEARLRLFMMVCQAVQHAHQKGVIHRDLKPTNILVTLHDGVPVPKVIDFGIAKATLSKLTEKTLFTQFHAFIGTPAYTSPEQMEMSGLDIDTRSDIYSLGVLLYELLAGRPPFDSDDLVKAGLEAMRRTIREVDPPRPSDRLITLAKEERLSVAQLRSTEAAKLSVQLNGDLDWIVMRCLEKDRTRRYETANGLALDIRRHLQNEPVAARPPSRAYVLRKLVRRNRGVFIAGAAIAVTVVLGLVASTWEAVRARRAERTAAQASGRAEDLLTFMLGDLRAQLAKVGRLDVLESVGDKAMAYFASLDAHDLSDTALARHSKALTQIGEIRIEQTRYAEAAAAFSEAYDRAAALAARHPKDGEMLFERGQAEYWNGYVRYRRGEISAAEEWMTRYRNTCAMLVILDPERAAWQSEFAYGQHNLAVLLEERGELKDARSDFTTEMGTLERMMVSDPGNSELQARIADVYSWLGGLAEREGDFKDAMKHYETQAILYQRLADADPGAVAKRYNQANALLYEVDVDIATGQFAAASTILKQAQELLDALMRHDASNLQWRGASFNARLKEAKLARQRGDISEAGRLVDAALPQLEALAATEPSDRGIALRLASWWRLRAQLQSAAGRSEAAESAMQAIAIGERQFHEGHANDGDVGECATAYVALGTILSRSGNAAEARRDWRRASELIVSRKRGESDWRLLDPDARAAIWMGRSEEARATISRLTLLGYVPLDPWPDPDRPAATENRNTP
jgi:serine/threonine protein kinase/tetratricopeptide (TPR) repeat protein